MDPWKGIQDSCSLLNTFVFKDFGENVEEMLRWAIDLKKGIPDSCSFLNTSFSKFSERNLIKCLGVKC